MPTASSRAEPSWLTFHSIYAFLFAASGLAIGIYVLLELAPTFVSSVYGEIGPFYVIAFGVLVLFSAVHQYQIYTGLYLIETNEGTWSKNTGQWAGSKPEKFLRFVILLIALAALSKGTPLFDAFGIFDQLGLFSENKLVTHIRWLGQPAQRTYVYLSLIASAFFLFVIWSAVALFYVKRDSDLAEEDKKKSTDELIIWIKSDSLAFLIWTLVALNRNLGAPALVMAVASFFILVYVIVLCKRVFAEKGSGAVEEHISEEA